MASFSFASIISDAALSDCIGVGIFNTTNDFSAIFPTVGLVPDVLPSITTRALGLQLPGNSLAYDIGHSYTIEEAASLPLFYLDPTGSQAFASVNATFVVITVDPDAITPQNRTIAQARHFVGANYKVETPGESTGLLTNSTPALSDWFPPGPPAESFPHRYMAMVYGQPDGFEAAASAYLAKTDTILNFNLTDFVAATNLAANPIAATFFMVGGSSVPQHSIAGQTQAIEESNIVGDLIPSFDPVALLDMTFPINGSKFLAGIGENFTVAQVQKTPQFSITFPVAIGPQLFSERYVLIMLDPDAPTPQNTSLSPFLHMVAQDLFINSTSTNFAPLYNSTPALAEYFAPVPPPGDTHRFTSLLFVQPENFVQNAAPLIPANRPNFLFDEFKVATGLGSPVAATYFRTGQEVTLS